MEIAIRDNKYEVIKDYGDTVSDTPLEEIITDYYDNFDYIVGDWAYGKVRLKGFYDKENKNCKSYNDYSNVDKYITENCVCNHKHNFR